MRQVGVKKAAECGYNPIAAIGFMVLSMPRVY
jgi:hypothetical protein